VYILRKPNTLRKYQDADETQAASRVRSSIPLCNIGLNLSVSGKGTFAAKTPKKENKKF
jgi:hypothetical protein